MAECPALRELEELRREVTELRYLLLGLCPVCRRQIRRVREGGFIGFKCDHCGYKLLIRLESGGNGGEEG